MANVILPGYVMPWNTKYFMNWDHSGPASYSTGGETINAADLGMGGFEFVDSMVDATAQLYAFIYPINGGNGNAVPSVKVIWYSLVTATVGGQSQTAGTQVVSTTNLSTFFLRMQAWCV